jgi:hypothetical protein
MENFQALTTATSRIRGNRKNASANVEERRFSAA